MNDKLDEKITVKSAIRASDCINAFIGEVDESVSMEPIKTGFNHLDHQLGGGLYQGLYAIGAVSSLGKTTFVLQIADYIAEHGTDVLIFSLEMSRFELIAKSISRNTCLLSMNNGAINERLSKTVRGITQGSRYKDYLDDESKIIKQAIEVYQKGASNLYICEGVGDISVMDICRIAKEHKVNTGRVPVIIVDYLQILSPYNERATDKQNTDKSVVELKRLSRDMITPVIAISSMNRNSYNGKDKDKHTDSFDWDNEMTGFKESGGIEYSCDVLIKLKAKNDKADTIRDVSLLVLKNRNGELSDKLSYKYHKRYNYFDDKASTRF
jgi:replicative DNA helicase